MKFTPEVLEHCRRQYPALTRRIGDAPAVYLDGPAGTQVPQRVIDAISNYLAHNNANHGGFFPTAIESDHLLEEVHRGAADFLGTDDPDTVSFGQNMTSLTFAFSRALAKTWQPGDEVIVTRLDHDANVTPWVLAAKDAGATLKFIEFNRSDCTLNLEQFRATIGPKTKLVAVGCASNATGGVNPVRDIASWAHQAGALVFLDAVHYAPHRLIDVQAFGCDFLACSAYKFFGPHTGLLWGKRELMEKLPAYKVRPAPDSLPGKWMTGTQSHESLAGVLAAIDYLADIGRMVAGNDSLDRREALREAYAAIDVYERFLSERLLHGLAQISEIKVWGLTDTSKLDQRVATISLTHDRYSSAELAERLGRQGIFAWHGNYYALQLSETLGHEPAGMLRVGLVHYNTAGEVDRLLRALEEILNRTMAAKPIDRSLGDGVYYSASDYVGLWRRIVILIVDSFLLLFVWALLAIAGQLVGLPGTFMLLSIAFVWWYEVPLKRSKFRTLGYWLMGCKIVTLKGERPSLAMLTFRALLWALGPFSWLFNLLWCGIDVDRQTLSDCYSKTCLVKVRAEPIGSGSVQLTRYFAGGMALFYPRVVHRRGMVK